ncbi:MAG: hypothetical protein ACRERD_17265 [Candidatus Binatia bacterium]
MEFASYAGPAMRSLTGWDKVVLLGDASHPSAGTSLDALHISLHIFSRY